MSDISSIIIPLIVLIIILFSYKKVNVYETFLSGVMDGIKIVLNIFPTVLAMTFAVNVFLDSNFLLFLLKPLTNIIKLPYQIFLMAFLKPVTGTASLSILTEIFNIFGPDSKVGLLASILQGCTDTTIYVIALYYGSIKVSKSRYTIIVGLLADLVGILMAFILSNIFF